MIWEVLYSDLLSITMDGKKFGLTGKVVKSDKLKYEYIKN